MPIEMNEKPESGKIGDSGRRIEMLYWLTGTTDKFSALAHVILNTAEEINSIPRTAIDLEVFEGVEDLWDIRVVYQVGDGGGGSGPVPTEVGDERESFTTRGSRIKVFQALEHIADYGNPDEGESIPNHGGAINVTPERIEGVEIDNAGFTFQVRKIVPTSQMTTAYRSAIFNSTDKVNSEIWRGYKAGELRLVNVDGAQRDSESWDLLFEFLAIPNTTNATIGDIEGVDKLGHEYAWSEHEKTVDETVDPPRIREKLLAVHIERVYEMIDFNLTLGLN